MGTVRDNLGSIDNRESEITEICRWGRIQKASFFGSVIRQDFRMDESDLDILVEVAPEDFHLLKSQEKELNEWFEDLFGRPVDVVILPPMSTIGNPYFEESLSRCLPFFENGEFVFSCLDRPLDPPDPESRYKGILYALAGNLENNNLAGLRNSLETSRRHREKYPNAPWSDLDQAVSGTLSQSDRETLVKKIKDILGELFL